MIMVVAIVSAGIKILFFYHYSRHGELGNSQFKIKWPFREEMEWKGMLCFLLIICKTKKTNASSSSSYQSSLMPNIHICSWQ